MDLFAEGGRKSFLPNVLSSRGRRPERQFLAYLSVGWCLGIFFAKFRRKSAGGKVAHGFVCKGVGEQAFYQMPCPPEAEGQGQIPCLSLCLSACGLVFRLPCALLDFDIASYCLVIACPKQVATILVE